MPPTAIASHPQMPITEFFDECTRDQRLLQEALLRNKDLNELIKKNEADALLQPNFLLEMVQHEANNRTNSKYRATYSDHMKNVALYIFILAGPTAYQTLQMNLPKSLPSQRTVARLLAEKEKMVEGEFRFERIKHDMLEKGEPLYVVVGEDDSKVSERVRYDSSRDEIVGIELPLNEDGVPIPGSFKFTM